MDKELRARHLQTAATATARARAELDAVWQEERRPASRMVLDEALQSLTHIADVIQSEL